MPLADALISAARELSQQLRELSFNPPVWGVYDAFDYALPGYEAYVRAYAMPSAKVLFLGMNPGPWGMAQTGIPFGEVAAVTSWLGLSAEIGKPPREHPKRPIEGFACQRSEVSGRRLWSLFAELAQSPQQFFRHAFVLNYCPLAFMSESGANITPDKLSAAERGPLEVACDAHLQRVMELFQPKYAIGVGAWATRLLQRQSADNLQIATLLHPSPASPIANREWPQRPIAQLAALGIDFSTSALLG